MYLTSMQLALKSSVLAPCLGSCLVLMGGCREKFHLQCCHWLAISVSNNCENSCVRHSENGDGHRRPPM